MSKTLASMPLKGQLHAQKERGPLSESPAGKPGLLTVCL